MGHWLVIDLEATTDEGGWAMEEMEIIEIGASLVGVDGHERDHFQRIVKPQRGGLYLVRTQTRGQSKRGGGKLRGRPAFGQQGIGGTV